MDALHDHKTIDNCNIHAIRRPAGLVGPDISGGPSEDIRPHEILGLTYRVKIMSSSFKRTREFSRTSRSTRHSQPLCGEAGPYTSHHFGGTGVI